MDLSREHPIRRFEDGRFTSVADTVVNETRIELDVNDGQLRLAMLSLPRDLEALAVGFLISEGALRRVEDLSSVEFRPDERKVVVRGDLDAEALEALSRRWTGGGRADDLDSPAYAPVGAGPRVEPQALLELLRRFHLKLELWRRTGGVHACALASATEILLLAEDVGRHNAFDKVIGLAAMHGVGVAENIVITTGRLSARVVSKAVVCGAAMLVSHCAVTGLAIELARRFGVTLVGFARGRRLNVYTGHERVVHAGGTISDCGITSPER